MSSRNLTLDLIRPAITYTFPLVTMVNNVAGDFYLALPNSFEGLPLSFCNGRKGRHGLAPFCDGNVLTAFFDFVEQCQALRLEFGGAD